jgi:hypothetical protein
MIRCYTPDFPAHGSGIMASHGHIYNDPRCGCSHCEERKVELLAEIQRNIDTQKRHPFDSAESVKAREANRPLFKEAKVRGLKGAVG